MMNLSAPFIARPVATTLLTLGVLLAGIMGFVNLAVSPLPKIDFPTISVSASLPGASPETVATSVTTPLERRLGAIAGVTEITSSSTVGNSRITLQFDLSRSIDGAARDVQAAINAARADLPSDLRSNPQYRKVNPADAPVLILALTSETLGQGRLYDAASNVLQQKLSQVTGVGQVTLGGSSLPAVRVEINPTSLSKYKIGLESVRAALASANANTPKGAIEVGDQRWQIYTNDQSRTAAEYRPLIIAWRNGAPVRLSDVAEVIDATENIRNEGQANGKRSVLVIIYLQPNANIIETVDEVKALLPDLQAALPNDVDLMVASDRTTTIRASLKEVENALAISVILVVLVTFAFLRSFRAGLVPSVAVPVSLVGTFGVMYLMGYSLNNLSLMAMTIAAGFVVDDAIIVLENIQRHIEEGMPRLEAALLGSREVGFTVVSMSLSLIAVFIPILLMGGIVGRLFREFAVTLSIAILISMVISLTTTPMMCAYILKPPRKKGEDGVPERPPGWLTRGSERAFTAMQNGYGRTLRIVLRHRRLTMAVFLATIILNIFLYVQIPKGFFPQQDTGQLNGGLRADQSISFQAMQGKLRELVDIIRRDPAVDTVVGFTGGGRAGGGFLFANLKPVADRGVGGQAVIARLRPQLARVTGVSLFLNPVQDLRMGGRQSSSTYQYTLKSDNEADLRLWATRLAEAMKGQAALTDVDTDQQENGVETFVEVDRDSAARLGIGARDVNNALYNGFGQRQVATVYDALNQYRVIMEVAPRYARSPLALNDVQVPARGTVSTGDAAATAAATANTGAGTTINPALRDSSTGQAVSGAASRMVPLPAIARFSERATPTSVNHQDGELATTVSFNLADGVALAEGQAAVKQAEASIRMPTNVRGSFQGSARSAQQSQQEQPLLILAAIVVIYLVLGVLYESLVHPLTVLSTLPSAGIGAVLALMLFGMDFSIIALIGLFLLLGIVKKNAILIIDFALEAERSRGLAAVDAVREACLLRFRPILMTTLAAALGALPLAIGFGEGAELRRPLGIAIIGGLIASQLMTLITTPVVYVLLDKLRRRSPHEARLGHVTSPPEPA